MIILSATTHTLELLTAAALSLDYDIAWADITTTAMTPGSSQGNVSTATTTTIVAAPAADTQRIIKAATFRNRSATTTQTVTIKKDVSGTDYYVTADVELGAGQTLVYAEGSGWSVQAATEGTADVVGPISATANNLAKFADASGKELADAGVGAAAVLAAIADLAAAGVGEAFGVVLTDLNVTITREPTLFSYGAATTNAPSTTAGVGIHIPNSATGASQFVIQSNANPRMFTRSASSGAWNSWIELALRVPRLTTAASASSLTPNWITTDVYTYTALAANLTLNAPAGGNEGSDGQLIGLAFKDDGTARTLTWNAVYTGANLPPSTIVGETLWVWFRRNATLSTYEYQYASRELPKVQSVTSASTVTPTFAQDAVKVTALAAACQLLNPTGTAIPMHGWAIRIKDNGTARALTYDTQYRAIGVTLPTTTVISKTLYLGCIWNSDDSKVDVVAVAQEA